MLCIADLIYLQKTYNLDIKCDDADFITGYPYLSLKYKHGVEGVRSSVNVSTLEDIKHLFNLSLIDSGTLILPVCPNNFIYSYIKRLVPLNHQVLLEFNKPILPDIKFLALIIECDKLEQKPNLFKKYKKYILNKLDKNFDSYSYYVFDLSDLTVKDLHLFKITGIELFSQSFSGIINSDVFGKNFNFKLLKYALNLFPELGCEIIYQSSKGECDEYNS